MTASVDMAMDDCCPSKLNLAVRAAISANPWLRVHINHLAFRTWQSPRLPTRWYWVMSYSRSWTRPCLCTLLVLLSDLLLASDVSLKFVLNA